MLALVVATSNFIYTQIKDRRARKQSIQDDYWFRKIVSPITIEPLVKDLLLLTTELPLAGSVDIASAKILWQNQAQRLEQLGSSLGTLSLLSQEIPAKVIKHIELISDELANYYGSYIEDSSNGTKLCDTELTRGSITKSMLSILKIIQLHQEKVGY